MGRSQVCDLFETSCIVKLTYVSHIVYLNYDLFLELIQVSKAGKKNKLGGGGYFSHLKPSSDICWLWNEKTKLQQINF